MPAETLRQTKTNDLANAHAEKQALALQNYLGARVELRDVPAATLPELPLTGSERRLAIKKIALEHAADLMQLGFSQADLQLMQTKGQLPNNKAYVLMRQPLARIRGADLTGLPPYVLMDGRAMDLTRAFFAAQAARTH